MAKTAKSGNNWAVRITLAVILIAALLISLVWREQINEKFGLTKTEESVALEKGDYSGTKTEEILELGGDLNVHFVDVGQGDACIIELPDERTMLIDAGDTHTENKQRLISYIEENINDESGNDIEYFDFVILTHPDSDHCGGMADVLAKYPAKTFYRPNVYSAYKDGEAGDDWLDPEKPNIIAATSGSKNNEKTTRAYDNALKAGYNESKVNGVQSTVHIIDSADDEIGIITPENAQKDDPDYYEFTFYGADKTVSYKDNNNYSPIMVLDYHGKKFMFSGDAEKEAEEDFVKKIQTADGESKYSVFTDDFTVDVFKLGHHGSRTSSSEEMIRAMTTPENRPNVIAVVSCGLNNSYKHPHSEVLDRLAALGFSDKNIVRTDYNGTIAMSVKGVDNEGVLSYELFMGAETVAKNVSVVKTSEHTVGNETIHLSWTEIVVLGIILVIAVLLIAPAVKQARKQVRKAAREAGINVQTSTKRKSGSNGSRNNTRRK